MHKSRADLGGPFWETPQTSRRGEGGGAVCVCMCANAPRFS